MEGREIISNLAKATGLAAMISTVQPDNDYSMSSSKIWPALLTKYLDDTWHAEYRMRTSLFTCPVNLSADP